MGPLRHVMSVISLIAAVEGSYAPSHPTLSSKSDKLLLRKSALLLQVRLYGGGEAILDSQQDHVPQKSTILCTFRVKVQDTKPGDIVRLVGAQEQLGNWKLEHAIPMKTSANEYPW